MVASLMTSKGVIARLIGLGTLAILSYSMVRSLRTAGNEEFLRYQGFGGTELTFIWIASSKCASSNDDRLIGSYPSIIAELQRVASDRSMRLATLGVGIDNRPEASLQYFAKLGPFNELSVGRGWTNSSALKYLWGQFTGPPAVPQVLILERRLSDAGAIVRLVESQQLLLRLVGTRSIRRWIDLGMPVPTSDERAIGSLGGRGDPTAAQANN
jgi:hypothetical protein